MEPSFLPSHLSGFAILKPGGGGPAGVAARRLLVENVARAPVAGAKVRTEFASLAVGRLRTTSIVRGFVDAIVWLLVVEVAEEGRFMSTSLRAEYSVEDNQSRAFDWPVFKSSNSHHKSE
jgi:hypothetical protein